MNINHLSDGQLDFIVARIEGIDPIAYHSSHDRCIWGNGTIYSPTSDEITGCHILVRERLSVTPCEVNNQKTWQAFHPLKPHHIYTADYLVAAMKCYVAFIYGDEINPSIFA